MKSHAGTGRARRAHWTLVQTPPPLLARPLSSLRLSVDPGKVVKTEFKKKWVIEIFGQAIENRDRHHFPLLPPPPPPQGRTRFSTECIEAPSLRIAYKFSTNKGKGKRMGQYALLNFNQGMYLRLCSMFYVWTKQVSCDLANSPRTCLCIVFLMV